MCCIDSNVSVTKLRLLMDKAQAQKKRTVEHGTAQRSREKPALPTTTREIGETPPHKRKRDRQRHPMEDCVPISFWLLLLPLSFSLCVVLSPFLRLGGAFLPLPFCVVPLSPSSCWVPSLPPPLGGCCCLSHSCGWWCLSLFQSSQQKQRRLHHPKGGGKTAPPTRERKRAAPDQRRREGDSSTSPKDEGRRHPT